jgi:hypothetical protein
MVRAAIKEQSQRTITSTHAYVTLRSKRKMGNFTYKQGDEVELNVESPGFLELGLKKGSVGKVVNASIGEILFSCRSGKSARILMSDFELRRKMDGQAITGSDLKIVGNFTVTLSSVGNPDYGQDPNRSLPGVKNARVAVRSKQAASDLCKKFIEANQLGSGNWSGGDIFDDGNLVARVSYNGRVWRAGKCLAENVAKPIDRPRG